MTQLVSTAKGIGRLDGHEIALLDLPYPDLGRALEAGLDVASIAKAGARERIPVDAAQLLATVPRPSKIWAIGFGYRDHRAEVGFAEEIGEPVIFLKAPSSVVGAGSPILLPRGSARRFDHETELAVIIGQRAKNVPRARALDFVFGYSCLMDITMRLEPDMPAEERPTRKSFDTFTPMGPYLVTADEIPDPQALENQLWVNGELRQSANTRDMTVGVAELIELVSSVMTLNPGDIIATGTPEGVGPIKPGDSVRIAIQHVGDMTMRVEEAEEFAPRRF
jgi:2-keto-4-pentenoate hydratase/2-oxohepta-3-ene-1,7-dioic acid hydratase in catechol pathway